MNRTDAPKKQPVAFGTNGQRENLPDTTPAGDNTASYDAGFPAVTMILKSAGGLPPKGQDMNQILFELSAIGRWLSAGALNAYDDTFSTAVGGYPKASVIVGDDGSSIYISTVDANTNNPNSTPTGWLSLAKVTAIAALAGGADKLPYFTGANTAAQTDLTSVGRDIIGKSAIADVLTYLGLGTAATKNVGTGTGQIPDMSSFIGLNGASGYKYLPGGTLIQWGTIATVSSPAGYTTGTFPIAFPNAPRQIFVTHDNPNINILCFGSADMPSKTQLRVYSCAVNVNNFTMSSSSSVVFRWFCIGD